MHSFSTLQPPHLVDLPAGPLADVVETEDTGYREFLAMAQGAGLDPLNFVFKSSRVRAVVGQEELETVVSLRWIPGNLSCTYWSSSGSSWLSAFQHDMGAGRFRRSPSRNPHGWVVLALPSLPQLAGTRPTAARALAIVSTSFSNSRTRCAFAAPSFAHTSTVRATVATSCS